MRTTKEAVVVSAWIDQKYCHILIVLLTFNQSTISHKFSIKFIPNLLTILCHILDEPLFQLLTVTGMVLGTKE